MSPKQKTYSLIFFIALLVSIVLYNYVLLEKLHQINIENRIKVTNLPQVANHIFYDLDIDNIKEHLSFGKDGDDKSVSFLAIQRNNGTYIGQFNFKPTNMRLEWIGYSDLNNDNKKEIIAFYEKQDTIYTSIIDWANETYIAENVFVLARPNTTYADTWSPTLRVVGDMKNSCSETEIIFSISTGFSQIPRGVFAFNTTLKKTTKKFVAGVSISHVKLFDLNRDGKDEIIINTTSSGNNSSLPKLPYINDFKRWLIVLDNNFDTLFTKQMDLSLGGTHSSYLVGEKENFLITAFGKGKKINLLKINKNGDVVKERISNDGLTFFQNQVYQHNEDIFLPTNKTLNILDSELTLIKKLTFESKVFLPYKVNLDNDSEKEIVLRTQNGIYFLDGDYSIIESISDVIGFSGIYSSISHSRTENGIKFLLSFPGEKLRFTVVPNILYSFRYILFIGLLFVVNLIGLVLHNILNRIYVFVNLLENSTQKSNLGIIVLTPSKKIRFANKSIKEILSSESLIVSKKEGVYKACKENPTIRNIVIETLKTPISKREEIILNNGKIVDVSIIPIVTPFRMLLALYIQIDNITESLITDRAKTLAHSIQKVAHEIKTPLSSVLLSLDSLEQNLDCIEKSESVKDDFKVARNEIDRIKNFINGFLKFANMAGIQLESCNLKEIIDNSLLRFSTYLSNGIEIEININSNINVLVDSYQIEEVFQVFIENSIDAMHGKGKLEIRAVKENKINITVSIKDNGAGINEEQLPSIFQPYMTTKKDGTGMGLAIAKKILEDHGSEIKVNSVMGEGTEFSFKLNKS